LYISVIMSTTELIEQIEKLPLDKQKEVKDFVGFLVAKADSEEKKDFYPHIKPGFGGGKGIFGELSDDFDEPLVLIEEKKLKNLLLDSATFATHIPDDFDISSILTQEKKQKRAFGELKGFVTYMSDDFNKPMDEFKDYI